MTTRCWCGMETSSLHYPGNDPESGPAHRPGPACPSCGGPADHHPDACEADAPLVCFLCGALAPQGTDGWTEGIVDTDPGDPEVGPDPCIQPVDICPACKDRR